MNPKKTPSRPSLQKRLIAFSAAECTLCLMSLLAAVFGLGSYIEFQSNPLSSVIVPAAFMFGPWPYVLLLVVAILAGTRAMQKAR